MSERGDVRLEFMGALAQHSRLRGDPLINVLRATVNALVAGTGSPEVSFVTTPAMGEDILVVHEIGLLGALEAADITVVPGDALQLPAPHPDDDDAPLRIAESGVATVPLKGASAWLGALRLAPPAGGWDSETSTFVSTIVAELSVTVQRHWLEQQHLDRTEALLQAQRHTHVGCFEWDVVADKVRWSDELFRIYGNEPQSFEPTFEEFLERIHEDDRESVRASVFQAYEERGDYRIEERIVRPDGSMRLLSSWGHVIVDENSLPVKILGSCQDVTELRATMHELSQTERRLVAVEERRTQALELNDNVVQGLATAIYALQLGKAEIAGRALDGTLLAARSIISDLLTVAGDDLDSASLIRSAPARSFLDAEGRTELEVVLHPDRIRVVLADDSEDIRLLVALILSGEPDFEVVAEAANGVEVVALIEDHQPDLVLLDLAMPLLDGLGAIPQIQTASPTTTIVVFSGFNAGSAAGDAIARGAHAFIEKGSADSSLPDMLRRIQAQRAGGPVTPLEP